MEVKKRKPIIAFLLSAFAPGLGQIYNFQLKKGIALYAVHILVPLTLFSTALPTTLWGLIILLAISLTIYLFIMGDAIFVAIKTQEARLKPYSKWYIFIVIYLLMLVISNLTDYIVKNYAARIKAFTIASGAMSPTLPQGEYIIVDRRVYKTYDPESGDVIVFKYPKDHRRDFVKRIVAVGGDTIELKDKVVMLNGQPIYEPYVLYADNNASPSPIFPRDNFGPIIVPEGKYFVLGDNRDQSEDSRYWGFVSKEEIIGKALYVYWSWDDIARKVRFERIGKQIN